MISSLRKHASSTLVTILLGLLIASFAIWGIGDVFRTRGSDVLATVGNAKVSPAAFAREYQNELNRWRQQFGESFSVEQANALGLPRQILQRMVNREIFDETGRNLGLRASDVQVRDFIRSNPAFRNSLGEFDRGLYANILRYAKMTEAQFETAARADITREQLLNSLAGALTVPDGLSSRLYTYHGETRLIDVARVPASTIGGMAKPDEAVLTAYYDGHHESYMAPEYRAVSYLQITAADFADEVTVGEQDILDYYDDHAVDYATPEARDLEQMVFSDRAAAQGAADAIRGGASFAAVAKEKLGLNADELSLGKRSEIQINEELGKDAAVAIFSTPLNEVAGPVQSSFGWHVIKVTAITPEVRRAIDEVRSEIEPKARQEKAIDLLYEMTNKVEDQIAGGSTLEDVAKEVGVSVVSVPAVDHGGRGPDGGAAANLPQAQNFLNDAFSTDVGAEPILHEATDQSYYLLRVDSVTPAALRPFESVKGAVEAAWTIEAQDSRAKEMAEGLKSDLAAGKALARVVPAYIGLQSGIVARRLPSVETAALAPEIRNAAFATPVGGSQVVKAADGDGYVVIEVTKATPGDASQNAKEAEEFAEGLVGQYSNDLLIAYQIYLTRTLGVAYNEKLFDDVVSQIGG